MLVRRALVRTAAMTQPPGSSGRPQTPSLDLDDDEIWQLVVVQAPQMSLVTRAFPLSARATRLGRDPEPGPYTRIVLSDERASRLHAAITSDERGVDIADCDSTN